jgi:hypothetical protein
MMICRWLPRTAKSKMTTKSREYLFGNSIRVAAQRAAEARKEADQLASARRGTLRG